MAQTGWGHESPTKQAYQGNSQEVAEPGLTGSPGLSLDLFNFHSKASALWTLPSWGRSRARGSGPLGCSPPHLPPHPSATLTQPQLLLPGVASGLWGKEQFGGTEMAFSTWPVLWNLPADRESFTDFQLPIFPEINCILYFNIYWSVIWHFFIF